ncbi:PAS domain-containing sensor histidine kinase [Vibrio salinus]|uniref:PAS domain-containing sensor histidine kinase n=1 Tax=Vibrio salinus TaxID=2899784 RepID=UPI001E4337CA|nr:ATP-binding protein [Vibrio salinus]MCE0494908.1 ATP-binding protein [Vibrio salinus]
MSAFMTDNVRRPTDSRLGKRIILLLIIISGTITFLATSTQLFFSYKQQMNEIEKRQHEIETIQLNLLASALWDFDLTLLQQRLDALVNIPHIDYLHIDAGTYKMDAGKKVTGSLSSKNYDIIYYSPVNNLKEKVGTLYLESGTDRVYESLINQFFTIFFINLFKTIIVCYIILIVFHYSINERLFTIMKYLRTYNPRHAKHTLRVHNHKLITSEHDEITTLAFDVDKLTTNLTKLYQNLKEEEKRLQDFAEVSSDWLWETDNQLKLIYCSDEMRHSLNLPEKSSINLLEIIPLASNKDFVNAVESKQSFDKLEIQLTLSEGNHHLLFQGKALYKKEPFEFIGFRGTAINISELKEAQIRLKQMNDNLESTVQERTKELNESMAQLKKTQNHLIESEKLAALGGLVAGVSHEVNTPLGISVTASSVIQEAVTDLSTAFQAQTLTTEQFQEQMEKLTSGTELLEQNLNRAAKLVKDFKQTAVDQVSESRDKFNIHQILSSLIASLHPVTRKLPVEPILDGNESLIMNSLPGVITQVISNLVMNSVNHAFDNESAPEIYIGFKEEGNKIIFEYRDNGKGVPKHLHKKIFEPFYTSKRGKGGSGLGLNLVYNLINQKLKGELEFSSEEGHGVFYKITLPKELEH